MPLCPTTASTPCPRLSLWHPPMPLLALSCGRPGRTTQLLKNPFWVYLTPALLPFRVQQEAPAHLCKRSVSCSSLERCRQPACEGGASISLSHAPAGDSLCCCGLKQKHLLLPGSGDWQVKEEACTNAMMIGSLRFAGSLLQRQRQRGGGASKIRPRGSRGQGQGVWLERGKGQWEET